MSYTPLNDLEKIAGNPVDSNIGNASNGTLRVVIASDQPAIAVTGGGGGGGDVQYADGTTQPTPTGTVALGKNPSNILHSLALDAGGNLVVSVANSTIAVTQSGPWSVGITGSVAVTGTFFQATQPVSLASLPALTTSSAVIGHVVVDSAPTTAVTGTFFQATQPISGTVAVSSVAGTITVSGVVTANVGTTGGLALDATLTGGTQKTLLFDGTNTIGISAHPVRTDPTGTTSQPVVGTQSDNSTNSTAKVPVISAVASASAPSYTAGHQVPLSVDLSGNLRTSDGGGGSSVTFDANTIPLFTRVLVNISSAGNSTIIAGISSQVIRIYRMTLVIQTATTIAFQDTTSTNLFPATPVTAASTFSGEFDTQPKFTIVASAGFVINLSVGSVVTGFIDFTQS